MGHSLNSNEFRKLLKDRHLIDNQFTEENLQSIFVKIQDDDDTTAMATGTGGEGEVDLEEAMELSYPEYLEGLCAVGLFRDPDPYIPLTSRIEDFFKNSILKGKGLR